MAIQEGEKLPEATLHTMKDGKPAAVSTAELFGGKKVVLFAVPGAFTPTCSMAHLPGYVVNADAIKGKGVDFMENQASWHYGGLDEAMRDQALESLGKE